MVKLDKFRRPRCLIPTGRHRPRPEDRQTAGMWRAFDVGAVVDSMLADAIVVAGRDGLDRTVRRANVATTPEDLRRAGAHELIVTNVDALLDLGEGWDGLIGRLDAAKIAALAVRLEEAAPLPDELLAAADQVGVPIIAFPRARDLAEVTNAVLDALLEAQGQRLERFIDIHQRFAPIVLSGGGASEIATALHSILQCPISVTDAEGRRIIAVPSQAGDDADLERSKCARQPIVGGDHYYGEIIALVPDSSLDDDGRLALERAASALAVRMAHATAAAAEHERFAATSLEELIAGHAGGMADVTERARSFGWDLTRPRAVLLASIDPPTEADTLYATLATIAAAARATLGGEAIVWTRSTTIAALVVPDTDLPTERRALADRLRHELDKRVHSATISIGVGRAVDDPTKLRTSYLEASRAVEVGRWAKGRHVTEVFDQLGLERLLASTPADDLAEFVEHSIGRLIDHDHEHGADLVATLGMWLETRNVAEAARRMHVHYNTFKNRLDRVETILGAVLADGVRSLECEVSIYVYRHYDGPWNSRQSS